MNAIVLLTAAGLFLSGTAGAEVYKCLEEGRVVYVDSPCPAGTGKAISVTPANQSEPQGGNGFGSSSNNRAVTVAPMVGSKLSSPSRSLDGHFEDLSYDNPQAAAQAVEHAVGRARGGGVSSISGGGGYSGSGTVYVGPRGGHYTITSGGNKSYQPR